MASSKTRLQVAKVARTTIVAGFTSWLSLSGCAELTDDPLPSGPAARAHPEGWIVGQSTDHHAKALVANGWDLDGCQSCHGNDYAGGIVMSSCFTCHDQGPEACDVCHGGGGQIHPPKDLSGSDDPSSRGVGAHVAHLSTTVTAPLGCNDCHQMPSGFADPAHIDGDGRAEVTFGTRAQISLASPVYNAEMASCANTYCHSGGRFGLNPTVTWNAPDTDQAACGTCHALPPGPETNHVQVGETPCAICHPSVVDMDNNIIDASRHMNGQSDL